jgi:hypothetical protein
LMNLPSRRMSSASARASFLSVLLRCASKTLAWPSDKFQGR